MENEEKRKNELLNCLQSHAYDFIAGNYYKLTKEELKTILLEFVYNTDNEIIREKIIPELKERL